MVHRSENTEKGEGFDAWVLEDLTNSGLTPENFTIELLKNETELRNRLGFTKVGEADIVEVGGYWIFYPNVPGYCRLKLGRTIETPQGKIKYLSPAKEKGFGNKPYILPETDRVLKNYSPDKFVFVTEGEKKAAKSTLLGFFCVGLSGVWGYKDSECDFLPELSKLVWRDRRVYIVFDSDISEKHGVKQAEIRLAVELHNRGAKVFSIRLPSESGREKNGLDDFLVGCGVEAFQSLIEKAEPTLELHVNEGTDTGLIFKELPRLDF